MTKIDCHTLPSMHRYRDKTIVIKYGGHAMTAEHLKQSFAHDIVLLQSAGIQAIIVHGGGPQIDHALNRLGKQGTFVQGMRVTDAETMQVAQWVLAGEVQQDITALINYYGGQAVGLTGEDGNLFRAYKLSIPDKDQRGHLIDIGFVGAIKAVNPSFIQMLQAHGFIPIISPIGRDEHRQVYNINADIVAGEIAIALQAEKLIVMTNIAGVQNKEGQLLTDLSARQIDDMLADGTISGGMLPKISAALHAAKTGVNSVHIIDGRIEHAVLHVLIEPTCGTVIRNL